MVSGPLPPPPGHRAASADDDRDAQARRRPDEPWPLPPPPGSAPRGTTRSTTEGGAPGTGTAPGPGTGAPGPGSPGQWSSPQWTPPGQWSQQGPWPPQQQWQAPGGPRRTDGIAVTALVLGILGLLASLIPFGLVVGAPLGIAAIVCGVIGIRRRVQRGVAIGGLVTGVLSLLVSIAYIALFVFVVDSGPGVLEDVIDEALQQASAVTASSACGDGAESVATAAVDTPPGVTVHEVEACPDFADDITWSVELENTGEASVSLDVRAAPSAGDGPTGEYRSTQTELAPGQRGWVEIITFEEWRTPLQVDLDVEAT